MPIYDYVCEICGRPGRSWRPEGHPPRFCCKEHKAKGMRGQPQRPKYIVTPEIHSRIEAVYKKMTGNGEVTALAAELGFPRDKVTRYAVSQGWIAKQCAKPVWTDEEKRQLQRFARYTPAVIQLKMAERGYKRTVSSIVNEMTRMHMLQNLDGHSATDVAACFGVETHCIIRALKAGRLHAVRRGTARTGVQGGDQWYILDKDIKTYILNHLHDIDIRKVDKYWFVDMIAN